MKSSRIVTNDIIVKASQHHHELLELEILKFIQSLQKKYSMIADKYLVDIAEEDGYTFTISARDVFLDADKYCLATEYTFYATKLNIVVASRKRTLSEYLIIGD